MRASEVLRRARAHVAGGWSEPMSLDSRGAICPADDEGIAKYCVDDALRVAAAGDLDALLAAQQHFEQQLVAVHRCSDLSWWLHHPSRTLPEVLTLFTRAHQRALAEETR